MKIQAYDWIIQKSPTILRNLRIHTENRQHRPQSLLCSYRQLRRKVDKVSINQSIDIDRSPIEHTRCQTRSPEQILKLKLDHNIN